MAVITRLESVATHAAPDGVSTAMFEDARPGNGAVKRTDPRTSRTRVLSLDWCSSAFFSVIDHCLKRPWTVLLAWAALWCIIHLLFGGGFWSWHFEATGVRTLFSPAAMHLYAVHPELQMGPLSFVIGAPFVLLLPGPAGAVAGAAFMMGVGLMIVKSLRGLSKDFSSFNDRTWILVGMLVLMVWPELAIHWGHLDDAMALYCAVAGLRAVLAGRMYLAAAVLALAVDFKPWALPFAALLLLAPARRLAGLGAVWLVLILTVWAPFVLADPATLETVRFAIPISSASTLHLLALPDQLTPSWCRYVQIFGGLALAAVAARSRRPGAVLLLAITVRLLLDPATKNYYDAGLLVASGVFDLMSTVSIIPLATLAATALVYTPPYLLQGLPGTQGVLRTVAFLGLAVLAIAAPAPATISHSRSDRSGPSAGVSIARWGPS